MTLLLANKARYTKPTLLLVVFICGQILGVSYNQTQSLNVNKFNVTDEQLLDQIEVATSALSSLFNSEEGIFLWNVQDPNNLSRYGNFVDLTNAEESLENLNHDLWLEGLAQDVAMQYLLLKNYIDLSLQYLGNLHDHYLFNREWIFLTETIISSLYYDIAINNQLIEILNELSPIGDGFGEFWNFLIRPKYNSFIGEHLSLLCDTFVLGSKILRAVEFMPYFSIHEKIRLLTLSETVSNWWKSINKYTLYDPDFSVAGIGNSKIFTQYPDWIGWSDFRNCAFNDNFTLANIYSNDHLEFQYYLYTSPQIADLYLTTIEKVSVKASFVWDKASFSLSMIEDSNLSKIYNRIINDYASHIVHVRDKVVYLFDPRYEASWKPLDDLFSGYSYQWDKYLIDAQGIDYDLYQYRYDELPLKITGFRSYQGAGDIRGLMNVFKVLSHGFEYQYPISVCEESALRILSEILRAQRIDSSFVISPYYGTALNDIIVNDPLINDAYLIYPKILPDGLDVFTGTMTVMSFLLEARQEVITFGYDELLSSLIIDLDETITSQTNLLIDSIDTTSTGISKQSIVGNTVGIGRNANVYEINDIIVSIDFSKNIDSNLDIPRWVSSFDEDTKIGSTTVKQWDYLDLLYRAYLELDNAEILEPLFDSLFAFNSDFLDDNQYQVLAICEVKDAVAKKFFRENIVGDKISLNDITGLYGNSIPINYRPEVLPVTTAFAAQTPQKLSALVLSLLPLLSDYLEIISNPINQVVIVGFISGLILTIIIAYIRRPKNN